MTNCVDLSLVIPIYNEEAVLPELLKRARSALDALGKPWEIVFVDDGSADRSFDMLRDAAGTDPRVKVLSFSRNFGHQTAITAGIEHAAGRAVVVMDGDLQDPPEIIADLVAKWEEGYQVVYAVRRRRKDGAFKRVACWLFYRLLNRLSYMRIPLDTGDFALMDRRVVDEMKRMTERNRFVRGLRVWTGFKQTPLEYERDERAAGRPKYTFWKLSHLAVDGIFSFSRSPLRLATRLGVIVTILAVVLIIKVLIWHFFGLMKPDTPPGWTTTVILILFLGGVQLTTIGILGEYVGRIYDEVKRRPLYIVRDKLGFEE